MKKGGIGEADSYFSPFSSGASPNPKNERNKMNSMLFRQDSNLTNSPHNQLGQQTFQQQQSTNPQQQQQQTAFSNPLENLLASANLGGVFLTFENPLVFADAVFDDPQYQQSNKLSLPSLYPSNGASTPAQLKSTLKEYRIKQHQLKKSNQLANRIQKKQDNRPKIFVNKSTDTTEDLKFAKLQYDRVEKENQLASIQKDTEDNIAEITKYLKSTTEFKLNFSGVSTTIKEVSKALQKKKFDTDQMLARENVRDEDLADPEVELKAIKDFLESEFVDVQRETASKILEFINRVNKEKREMPRRHSGSKPKKTIKEKPGPKKDLEIQQLRDRVGFLEGKVEENNNELEKAADEMKDLKFQVDYKEKDLTKLNGEMNLTKEELNKAEVDRRALQTQVEKTKQAQEKLNDQKLQDDKVKDKISQKLKQTENRVIDIERENYVLRDEISRIQQLSKNVDEQEKMNMQVLCQMVIDSNMSPEEQKKALLKIQQLYIDHPSGSSEINQERQKYISSMMTQFKQSKNQTYEDFDQSLNNSKQKSLTRISMREKEDRDSNNSSVNYGKKQGNKSQMNSMRNIKEEQDGFNDIDSQEPVSQQFIKEKRVVKQKVTKTIMQKKTIVNEQGENVVVDEPVEVETEEEVEIEVNVPASSKGNVKPSALSKAGIQKDNTAAGKAGTNNKTTKNLNNSNVSQSRRSSMKKATSPMANQSGLVSKTTISIANKDDSNIENPQENKDGQMRNNDQKLYPNKTSIMERKSTETIQQIGGGSSSSNNIRNQQQQLRKFVGKPDLGENVFFNEEDFYQDVQQEVEVQDGWEEVEQEITDENGNKQKVKTNIPKMVKKTVNIRKKLSNMDDVEVVDQEQEVEVTEVDPVTGETRTTTKKVIKKVAVPKDKVNEKYDFIEKESFEDEKIIDPQTGEETIVQKRVLRKVAVLKGTEESNKTNGSNDQPEYQDIERIVTDPITGETKTIIERVITNASKKTDGQNGNNKNQELSQEDELIPYEVEVSEDEEVIDQDGNVQKTKKKVKKIQMMSKNQLKQKSDNSSRFDTIIGENTGVQATQTEQFLIWPIIQALLFELDIDPAKIAGIQNKYFDENNPAAAMSLMDLANSSEQKKQESQQRQIEKQQQQQQQQGKNVEINEGQNQYFSKDGRQQQQYQNQQQGQLSVQDQETLLFLDMNPRRVGPNGQLLPDDEEEFDERRLEVLDDKHLLAESTIKKIFLQLQKRDNRGALQIQELIRKYYNKPKHHQISYDEFKQYYIKILTIHQRCGDNCPHLMRFFIKIGFSTNRYGNRREIKPAKQKLNPFNEVNTQSAKALPTRNTVPKTNSNSNIKQTFNSK